MVVNINRGTLLNIISKYLYNESHLIEDDELAHIATVMGIRCKASAESDKLPFELDVNDVSFRKLVMMIGHDYESK